LKKDKDFSSRDSGGGRPLGLRSEECYKEKSFSLEEGDLLLLYSDGAIDARSQEHERYGTDRLRESMASNSDESVEELLGGILGDLEKFRGKEPWADDLTLLAFKCL